MERKIIQEKNVKGKNYMHVLSQKYLTLDARKKWIIRSLNSSGKIYIDTGAIKAILNGKSLLAAGIIKVSGIFNKGDNILIVDHK